MASKAQRIIEEREDAINTLRGLYLPGMYVPCVLRHVSRSGMMRAISTFYVVDGEISESSWLVARATQARIHQNYGGVIVGGAGMDMGFHLVYGLSRTLYPNGHECIEAPGVRCPSNDHSNRETRKWHPDGGYALRHRWV